jgi:hypothetical protein
MSIRRIGIPLALVLAAQVAGSGCLLFPEVEDRVVDLALGASTTATLTASGEINTLDDRDTVDVVNDVDLAGVLADAGIDVSDLKSIAVSGVSYRISRADPTTGRAIQNGTVTIQRAGGPETTLISNFASAADAVTPFQTAALDAAGVLVLNDILADILAELQGGPAANGLVYLHVAGQSTPSDPTDFEYQIKLDVSMVGSVKVQVVD